MKGKKCKHSTKNGKCKIPQKIALAQLKNEYCRRYIRVAKALGALETYKKLTENDHTLLWLGRLRAIRVEPEKDVIIRSLLLDYLRKTVSCFTRFITTSIVEGGPEVTLEDYFTAGVMFGIFARTLSAQECKKTEQEINEIKKAFEPVARKDRYREPYTKLSVLGISLARLLSRPTSKIYSIRYGVHFIESGTSADCLFVKATSAPCLYLTIDKIRRQCYHLGWPGMHSDFAWGSIDGATLGIDGAFAKLKFDLYIQPHALHRLRERTTPIDADCRFTSLYNSLDNQQYHAARPGTCLLEYRIKDTLIGYFLIEAISGVALIKTFLFVTNSGTPEGTRFDRILGARKEDKEFTGIDKLGTLLTTDILQNPTLRAVLTKAGLESLIRFCETFSQKTTCKKGFNSFFDRYMGFPVQSQEQEKVEMEENVTVGSVQ